MGIGKEIDTLQIIKEDILEALGKKGKKVLPVAINPEIKVSRLLKFQALEELEEEGSIKTEGKLIYLTAAGLKKAEEIAKKHLVIENYFRKSRSKQEAFKAAGFLEHYVSQEVIDNFKELASLKKEGIALADFKEEQGLITDIVSETKLFERIISMGICPGSRIKILNKLPNGIIVEIENKKFALGKKISQGIKLVVL